MPSFNLRIEMTDADKDYLEKLVEHSADEKKREWKSEILKDRVRAIEQVKRLYAVIIGFAVWSCITNAYQCARKLQDLHPPPTAEYSILIAQVVSFISLVALFYLGAERMLDRKYLERDSPVPTRMGLLFDLFTLFITAAWFAILANTFPSTLLTLDDVKTILPNTGTNVLPVDLRRSIHSYFGYFILFLLILYAIDIFLLIIHGLLVWRSRNQYGDLLWAYQVWIIINVISLLVMSGLLHYFKQADVSISYRSVHLNVVALSVFVLHVARFFFDFLFTFKSYYPTEDPEKPPKLI